MPVPPKRRSASKKRRGWAHFALKRIKLVVCSHCKKKILPHQVCVYCGYYQGRQVLTPRVKAKKRQTAPGEG